MELPNKFTVPVILIYKANNIVIKCYIYNYHEEINKDTLNPKKLCLLYKTTIITREDSIINFIVSQYMNLFFRMKNIDKNLRDVYLENKLYFPQQ